MNRQKRIQNEREFEFWNDLENGGRKYWFEIKGRMGGFARYIKVTDSQENTISFVQEIYNSIGELTEKHEKFPLDKGHQKIKP
jgi:hypothetical protein